MNKKLLVVAGILFVLSLAVTLFIWLRRPTSSTSSTLTPKLSSENLVWDDPAGFTFEYPEGVEIDKHDEDEENYAHVELTQADHPGSIIVWGKDMPLGVTTLEEWIESDEGLTGANVIDTTLGEEPAKKIMVTSAQKVVVGAIYDDVLWYIEGEFVESDFWSDTFETITSSFSFKPLSEVHGTDPITESAEEVYLEVDEEETLE